MDMSPSPFKMKAKALYATSGRRIDYAPPTVVWIPEVPPVSTEISHSYMVLLAIPSLRQVLNLLEGECQVETHSQRDKENVTSRPRSCMCRELTIHLYQEFWLDSPASLVLTVRAPLAANGVYLVDKNGAWCIVASLWVRRGGGRGMRMEVEDGWMEELVVRVRR